MLTPVLYQEMLLGGRRNRAYFFRWFYAAWTLLLLLGFLLSDIWRYRLQQMAYRARPEFAEFARAFLEYLVVQHFWILLIATPVLTAGAISDENVRGTLSIPMLVTEHAAQPGNPHRQADRPVFTRYFIIALTPLPLICSFGVFGSVDLLLLLSIGISSLAMAFGVGSMSLLASVLCRHTRDAVLSFYAVGGLLFLGAIGIQSVLASLRFTGFSALAGLIQVLLNCLNPLHPMGTGWALDDPVERAKEWLPLVAAWGFVGLISLVVAMLWLRAAIYSTWNKVANCGGHGRLLGFSSARMDFGRLESWWCLSSSLRKRLIPYLKGTTSRHWATDLALFLLAWTVLGLVPLLAGIAWLFSDYKSRAFLNRCQVLWRASQLTRRARGSAKTRLSGRNATSRGSRPLAALHGQLAALAWDGIDWLFDQRGLDRGCSASALSSQHDLGTVVQMIFDGDLSGLITVHRMMESSSGAFWSMGFVVLFLASLVVAIRSSRRGDGGTREKHLGGLAADAAGGPRIGSGQALGHFRGQACHTLPPTLCRRLLFATHWRPRHCLLERCCHWA